MNKKSASSPKRKTFKQAVDETSEIAIGFQDGLKALGKYSSKIIVSNTHDLHGSVDIDESTRLKYPQENRWDYTFAYKGQVYFVEVHSAKSIEVSVVKKKLQWLKNWLHTKAPELQKLQAPKAFHWIQSGNFSILKGSPQFRAAAQIGLIPKSNLTLE